ncbi:MAG: hypothetical protein AAF549_07255 [Pseudomonadota bacterium]
MKVFNLIIAVILVFSTSLSYAQDKTAQDFSPEQMQKAIEMYQHDMDIVRLMDLKEIGALIKEYKSKKGVYPFQNKTTGALIVPIATKEQIAKINFGRDPRKPVVFHYNDFVKTLEDGLERKISLPFDPQRVFSGRQNFYLYEVIDDYYTLAIHLFNEYDFAQEVGKDWYKVEVSSLPNPNLPIWDYDALMNNKSFQNAIAIPLKKEGYVEPFRQKLRDEVGFN